MSGIIVTPPQPVEATPGDAARWRFGWLYAAPHRMAFSAGALLFAASGIWWALALLAQTSGHAPRWGLPPIQAHGLLMTFGFMPMFFAGFLFTAGPKWLRVAPPPAAALVSPLAAQLSGWAVFALGMHGRDAAFGAALGGFGLAAVAFGWTHAWLRFVALLWRSRADDRVHARVIAGAGALGALALWAAAYGVATGDAELVRTLTVAALWSFIGLVYAAVLHRMVPFFTAAALPGQGRWQPMAVLWTLVSLMLLEGGCVIAEALWGPFGATGRALQAAIELPAGAALLALAIRWGLVQSLKVRLLAMLHIGFVWLGIACVLAGVSHLLMAASGDARSLGVAPLHAYTMGFLGSTLIAMATRVSVGHGGRVLAADDFVWRLYGLVQLAVLTRVTAALLAALGFDGSLPMLAAAALVWGTAAATWSLRYGRWYGLPRADGRPG
jgi:uncharacterized protein involved in response to NO